MAVPALTPTSSVKRRRITNDGRGNTPVSTPNSVKKRRTRVKDQSEMPLIDLDDSNDPYNFTANSDSHPEPLADICVSFYIYFLSPQISSNNKSNFTNHF